MQGICKEYARNMVKSLNQNLKDFKNWGDEVKFELNPNKTKMVLYTINRKNFKCKPNIYLNTN